MWILRIKSSNNNHGRLPSSSSSSSISALQSLIYTHYSTKSTAKKHPISHPHFMVDYLINSLGFSQDQALSTATKVSHIKSTRNPNSVVEFFKQCGLCKAQIRNVVSSSPRILTTSVHKTLEPKFRVFKELGLSGSGLEKLFKPTPCFSSTRLIANVDYLKKLLDNDEKKVIKVIHKSWWLLSTNFAHKLSANLLVLKKYGLPDRKIESILMQNPAYLLQTPEWLDSTIKTAENVLGISFDSARFVDGFETVASMTDSKLEMKFGIYRRFGWSDSEIVTMTRALPTCLRRSEAKLETTLKFFMNELGYTAAYLATHPKMLVYSLEKRVMPRNKVLVALKEKKLLKSNSSLCSIVGLSEVNFMKYFVLPYRDFVPNLYEAYYTDATGNQICGQLGERVSNRS